jgi:hypothetical protein
LCWKLCGLLMAMDVSITTGLETLRSTLHHHHHRHNRIRNGL